MGTLLGDKNFDLLRDRFHGSSLGTREQPKDEVAEASSKNGCGGKVLEIHMSMSNHRPTAPRLMYMLLPTSDTLETPSCGKNRASRFRWFLGAAVLTNNAQSIFLF